MPLSYGFAFMMGLIGGFLVSLYTLDRMYRTAFKEYTENVYKNYQKILKAKEDIVKLREG